MSIPGGAIRWSTCATIPVSPLDRMTRTKDVLHILDLSKEQPYVEGNPRLRALVDAAGARTMLLVPMLKDDDLIGAIVIYRQEVRPFTDKQIELVRTSPPRR